MTCSCRKRFQVFAVIFLGGDNRLFGDHLGLIVKLDLFSCLADMLGLDLRRNRHGANIIDVGHDFLLKLVLLLDELFSGDIDLLHAVRIILLHEHRVLYVMPLEISLQFHLDGFALVHGKCHNN